MGGSRLRLISASLLLSGFAVLTFLPWFSYWLARGQGGRIAHSANAWSGADYWTFVAVLGLMAAGCLFVRGRLAAWVGAGLAVIGLGFWVAEAWSINHPGPVGPFRTVAIANFTSDDQLYTIRRNRLADYARFNGPYSHGGQTALSYLAAVLLLAMIVVLLLRTRTGQSRVR